MTALRKVPITLVTATAVLGCAASTPQLVDIGSGIQEMTLKSGFIPVKADELRLRVEEEAARHCRTRGRAYSVIDTRASDPEPPDVASAVTRFRCV